VIQTKAVSRKLVTGKNLRYLLCDDSGRYEPKPIGEEWVHTPAQYLDRAIERNLGMIAICFGPMLIQERASLVELCALLKRNPLTRNCPLLALLHEKHRGLIEDLKNAGVDFVKFIDDKRLSSSLMIEMIDRLSAEDRAEQQLEGLCPFLHYEAIDDCREIKVCGAYLDRMVLGGKRLHGVCETENHLSCGYFLNPRVKS
jgi:hypothetical protein